MAKPRVIVESPYAGTTEAEIERNEKYLRAALRDCLLRGEAPFASHGLYTQEGVLDDKDKAERDLGIEAGFAWGEVADKVVFYVDLGLSPGMMKGIENAVRFNKSVEKRTLPGWSQL